VPGPLRRKTFFLFEPWRNLPGLMKNKKITQLLLYFIQVLADFLIRT
jgi:hypothetical protein